MTRSALLTLVALLLAASSVPAEEPLRREDFAYCLPLKLSGSRPVASLSLPAEIYKGCTRPDLGDLRVFNAQGPVPQLLRPLQPEQAARPPQSLPFFPLTRPSPATEGITDLGISIGSSGAILAIRAGQTLPAGQSTTAYLLDASALASSPDWLDFAWNRGQFSASVRLDSSNDLNTWRPVVASAALAELNFGGHQLLRRRIELSGQVLGKYLRMSWPQGKEGISLNAVQAGYESQARAQARTLLRLVGRPAPSSASGRQAWLYSTDGFFPVDQLALHLPEQNSLADVAIYSRPDEQAVWQRQAGLLAWQVLVDGVRIENGVLRLAANTDRYWRLETDAGSSGAPLLELGWLPGQLVFMTQGSPPYTLAYGKAGLEPARSQVGHLLRAVEPLSSGNVVEAAEAGPQQVLAGEAAVRPVKKLPWRLWLLWLGLLVGVLTVGAMALKLFREMEKN